jgi:hypothetical protein
MFPSMMQPPEQTKQPVESSSHAAIHFGEGNELLFGVRFINGMKVIMKRIILLAAVALLSGAANAQNAQFLPGRLAVLRAGDGVVNLHLKQAPVFVDQFDPNGFNPAPSFTVRIPTNGPSTLFFNSHAATEGVLTRSADRRMLAFAGYGGVNLLEQPGTPSLLDIKRGICTVDAAGTVHTYLYFPDNLDEKMNPRGVATDGTNNFWGCGNVGGTFYYNPNVTKEKLDFESVPNTRAMKIINNVLYTTLNGADATAMDKLAGIHRFVNYSGDTLPYSRQADAVIELVVPATAPYTRNVGFDMNPDRTIAYMSDTVAGIEKYIKSGGAWKFAYNFAIPQNIPAGENHATGCFGLVVDFSGAAPVIYATTTEGYGGTVNSNRVVRIVDTNATAVVTTVAQSTNTNIAFRGIDFTPELGNVSAPKP